MQEKSYALILQEHSSLSKDLTNRPQYTKYILWLFPVNVHLFWMYFQGILQNTSLQIVYHQTSSYFWILYNFRGLRFLEGWAKANQADFYVWKEDND